MIKYSKMYDFWTSNTRWLFYSIFMLPVLMSILWTTFYEQLFDESVDPSYNDDNTFVALEDLTIFAGFVFPIALIIVNFVLFILILQHSRVIMSNVSPTRERVASTQSAISTLVRRLKYFPIIQSLLLLIAMLDAFKLTYLALIFVAFPSSAYLILFLKMQPSAWAHLKFRFGCGGKLAYSSRGNRNGNNTSMLPPNMSSSLVDSDAFAQSISHPDATADYDLLEDDELSTIINSASVDGSRTHSALIASVEFKLSVTTMDSVTSSIYSVHSAPLKNSADNSFCSVEPIGE